MKLTRLFIINAILVLVSVVLGLYALTGNVIFGPNPFTKMPIGGFISLTIVSLLTFATLIFINIRNEKYKPSFPFIIALSVSFFIGMISILLFKDGTLFNVTLQNGDITEISHSVESITKFTYVFQFLLLMTIAITIIDIAPKIFKDTNLIKYFCFLGLLVSAFLIVFSYINEYESYYHMLSEPDHFWLLQYAAHSLLPNKNSYAIILFSGIVACLILHQEKFKWWWVAIALFIFFNMVFTMSKTTLLISGILLLGYFTLRFIQTIKVHPKMNFIALGSVLLVAIIGISVISFLNLWDTVLNFFNLTNGLSTVGSRILIWDKVIQILNQTNWISGPGYHIFNDILFSFNCLETPLGSNPDITPFAHNMFLELIGSGGITLFIIAIVILAYLIYVTIHALKEYKTLAIFEFILIGVLLILAFFESGSFIFPSTLEYAFISFMVFMPIMSLKSKFNLKINL